MWKSDFVCFHLGQLITASLDMSPFVLRLMCSSSLSFFQEYMQSGRATEKTDVYSFGVLVLEVISGKRPTDASYIEKGFNIVGWVCCVINRILLLII